MSKCREKVEKTAPWSARGVTKKLENCPKDAKGEGIYCEVHGCFDCSLKSAKTCLEHEGVKLCLGCRAKREFKKKSDEERKKEIIEEGRKAFREEKERLRKEAEERERDKLKDLPDWDLLSTGQQQLFFDQINSSSSSAQFKNIFDQVQQATRQARNERDLLDRKSLVVQEIKNFLLADPVINAAELATNNSNWKNEINGAADVPQVNQIKDRVVADIKAKKAEKATENELSSLIQEAQGSMNSNLLDKLQKDLEKINAYRNQSVFQKRKKEVEVLENYLFSANLSKYREFIVNSIQKELASEPFPVLVEELKDNNRDFVTQINQLTDQQALENVKSSVLNNVGEKKAEKLVDNLLVRMEQDFDSEADTDRSSICQEIYRLRDNGNQWERNLWEAKKEVFEEFLRGKKKKKKILLPNKRIIMISPIIYYLF